MEKTRKIHASLNPSTEGYPVTFTVFFNLQLKASGQVLHHYLKCYAAVVRPDYAMLVKAASVPRYTICWYECLPPSCNGCAEMDFSKLLGLAKNTARGTIPTEGQHFTQLLSKMERKACRTHIPGSNSAWKVKQ